MLQAFKANLKGNHLEWLDDQPISNFDKAKSVYVIFLEESQKIDKRQPAEDSQLNETTLAALPKKQN